MLGEKNKDDIQYVTNNLSRLDQDGNGFIEFDEFVRFPKYSGKFPFKATLWRNSFTKDAPERKNIEPLHLQDYTGRI